MYKLFFGCGTRSIPYSVLFYSRLATHNWRNAEIIFSGIVKVLQQNSTRMTYEKFIFTDSWRIGVIYVKLPNSCLKLYQKFLVGEIGCDRSYWTQFGAVIVEPITAPNCVIMKPSRSLWTSYVYQLLYHLNYVNFITQNSEIYTNILNCITFSRISIFTFIFFLKWHIQHNDYAEKYTFLLHLSLSH